MPLVTFLRTGDGAKSQHECQQPQPAFDLAQARRQAAAESQAEARMNELGEVSFAAAVAAPKQGEEPGTDEEARAEPQWLGEVESEVIRGA